MPTTAHPPVKWDKIVTSTVIAQGLKVARDEHGVAMRLLHVLGLPHCGWDRESPKSSAILCRKGNGSKRGGRKMYW